MTDLLARPWLDLGIPTDDRQAMCAFYEGELGLELLQVDAVAPGHDEIYYVAHGSWVKLNASAEALAPAVTGYQRLLLADARVDAPRHLVDPDGLEVVLVPPGHEGIDEVGVVVRVGDVDAQRRFLVDALEAEPVGDGYRVGNTVLLVEQAPAPLTPTPILTKGFTMLTLIVADLPSTHQRLVEAGGSHGLRVCADPAEPGRCLFSFVRDPNGNWIELVQFADLSGPLPDVEGPPPTVDEFLAFRDHGTPA